jgi:hypothetical protein
MVWWRCDLLARSPVEANCHLVLAWGERNANLLAMRMGTDLLARR